MITFPWFAPVMWAVFIGIIVWFTSVLWPFFAGAPWVPMRFAQARRMLQLAGVRPGETVYDLGSGDGRVLIVAAREFGANAVGVEIDPLRAGLSALTLGLLGLRRQARVIRANLFDVDLSQADVVVVYLLPGAVVRLAPKLQRELKAGAKVATLDYQLPEWETLIHEGRLHLYSQAQNTS